MKRGNELDVIFYVFIFPAPLKPGNFDCHFSFRSHLHVDQCRGRGHRHGDQDQNRDDGPDDFRLHTVRELGGFMPFGFPVQDDGNKHGAENEHANHHANPENDHVKLVAHHRLGSHTTGHVDSISGVAGRSQKQPESSDDCRGYCCCNNESILFLHRNFEPQKLIAPFMARKYLSGTPNRQLYPCIQARGKKSLIILTTCFHDCPRGVNWLRPLFSTGRTCSERPTKACN